MTESISTLIAVVALIVAIASAAFTRGQLQAAQRANQLSEYARSTALDIEQNNTVHFNEPARPGHYSGAHPQVFESGQMEFDPESMSFISVLKILNMGPSNCFRLTVKVTSAGDKDFSITQTKPILVPGEVMTFEMNSASIGLSPTWRLCVTWRDELGTEHKRVDPVGPDGYFTRTRTNAQSGDSAR